MNELQTWEWMVMPNSTRHIVGVGWMVRETEFFINFINGRVVWSDVED